VTDDIARDVMIVDIDVTGRSHRPTTAPRSPSECSTSSSSADGLISHENVWTEATP
jgi:hypothetical protein